jgi:hypothetical protein
MGEAWVTLRHLGQLFSLKVAHEAKATFPTRMQTSAKRGDCSPDLQLPKKRVD